MTKFRSTTERCAGKRCAAAAVAIAVLGLLLAIGAFWAWRARNPSAPPPSAQGPLAKVAAWVEPPQPALLRGKYLLRKSRLLVGNSMTMEGTALMRAAGRDGVLITPNIDPSAPPPRAASAEASRNASVP